MTKPPMFDSLYTAHDRPIAALGERYRPPARFIHGEDALVATLPKQKGNDGQPVEVYECRLPARFYKVVALPTKDSIRRPRPGFTLSTGSSMHELAGQLAVAINDGMLSLEVTP